MKLQLPSSSKSTRRFKFRSAHESSDRRPAGKHIEKSESQPKKTSASIRESFEPDANVIAERQTASAKQRLQSNSTDEGMQIDESSRQSENAAVSIRES
jgi:hypothetical protein